MSYNISALFSLRYPINCDTLSFGGMHTHSVLIIFLTSSLSLPYSCFFLYLGIKAYGTGISILYVIYFYCPFGPPPILWDWFATPFSLYHRRLFYNILYATAYSILPSIAGGLGFSFSIFADTSPQTHKNIFVDRTYSYLLYVFSQFVWFYINRLWINSLYH